MVRITGHADALDADFARIAALGFGAARESLGWRIAEPGGGGRFDFARALATARAAERHGVQVLWTLMHYGVPPDVNLLDDAFIARFVDFAAAAARALRPYGASAPVITPINEISYLAWAVCESNTIHPHVGDRSDPRHRPMPDGFELKRRLVQATLQAMAAMRSEDPRIRFLHIDPIVNVVAPHHAGADLTAEARRFHGFQWQAWDMLAGRLCPELGGSAEALDLIGVNHYSTGQWEFATGDELAWQPHPDPRRVPFADLLGEVWQRYGRPVVVAETGHVGASRAAWLEDIAGQVEAAVRVGVPVQGLCLYPIVDRPDWDAHDDWHRCGLWDAAAAEVGGGLASTAAEPSAVGRHLHPPLADALLRCQQRRRTFELSAPARPNGRGSPSSLLSRRSAITSFERLDVAANPMKTLVVFCHLRWDFVYQRPQHLLSRLAATYRVVVIEEPLHCDGPAHVESMPVAPGVEVLRPHTAVAAPGFADAQLAVLAPMLAELFAARRIERPIVWLYTPMALALLDRIEGLHPELLVYDCMDELSAFLGAPPELRRREAELLARADLVLTGGPSLYAAKRGANPNVLCLPSSVDAEHFAPREPLADGPLRQRADALQIDIAEPRLGFFGVIDERMNLDLLAALADAEPGWQLVMVGPVVKIDPATLPRRANVHWLGQQPYELLPWLVDAWQVCLLPFAINEATRFISPTKTLEYMAAGKPTVSTAIRDVSTLYGDVVQVASGTAGFIDACRAALSQTPAERRANAVAMAAAVSRSSWDRTARCVVDALETASAAASATASAPALASAA